MIKNLLAIVGLLAFTVVASAADICYGTREDAQDAYRSMDVGYSHHVIGHVGVKCWGAKAAKQHHVKRHVERHNHMAKTARPVQRLSEVQINRLWEQFQIWKDDQNFAATRLQELRRSIWNGDLGRNETGISPAPSR